MHHYGLGGKIETDKDQNEGRRKYKGCFIDQFHGTTLEIPVLYKEQNLRLLRVKLIDFPD